ncbi:Na+/H+ antiporter [Serinicoccus hydrothermalis]|uniref:Na+/H+ antiporter n=1 Tax=Serinicoccus hydrothermalis TaxID=1758689 RepID=A0A1B1NCT5_9MICO|nr:Na+/H+ antiporter [Serinicoccus hydrothermalis]ANS79201.1 Na+/H+ antiporter [Serinicoccus hydrothermalis]
MDIALVLVLLALVVIVGESISERLGAPAPLLLTVLGIALSFVPGVPEIHLEPEIVLIGLLPPLLWTASLSTSLVDLKANIRPIMLLSVAAVLVTALAVAVVVRALLPDIGWPMALAIGAVVAPPDAVAATAVGRRIGLPRRVVSVLEGESLLNDATALVALRTSISALAGGVSAPGVAGDFLLAAGGGVLVGLVVYKVVAWVRKRLRDPLLDTAVSFVTPFVAYLLAETISASGVISVVVAGLLLSHRSSTLQTAQGRIVETTTWRTISFLLENVVFLLIGLQARWIVEDLSGTDLSLATIVGVPLLVLLTVVVVRMAWVHLTRPLLGSRLGDRRRPAGAAETTLIGWAGMRGVVTLAAALVLPEDAPYRDLLLLVALTVVAGTLLVQGLTLPALTRALRVSPPDPADDALARATLLQQAATAGLERLEELETPDNADAARTIRQRLDQRTFAAWEQLSTTEGRQSPSDAYAELRRAMIVTERERILHIRAKGKVPSPVVRQVLGMLDLEESMIDSSASAREDIRATGSDAHLQCPELRAYPVGPAPEDPRCEICEQEGREVVALRQCLECGNVACCDSSTGQHATAHFHETGHPVIRSAEPGESWRWCYVHHLAT